MFLQTWKTRKNKVFNMQKHDPKTLEENKGDIFTKENDYLHNTSKVKL